MLHAPLPSGVVQTARCAPLTATAPQPAIGAPFAVKPTVPLLTTGLPSTVAVSETIPAAGEGIQRARHAGNRRHGTAAAGIHGLR